VRRARTPGLVLLGRQTSTDRSGRLPHSSHDSA
jgi:hypothetical protein